MKKVVLASALLLSIGFVQAAESVRWDSASLSYQSVDIDIFKLTGFGVSGTKLIGEDFFIAGSYSSVSGDNDDDKSSSSAAVDLDLNTLSVGLGYRHAISSKIDLFGVFSYQNIENKMYIYGRPFGQNGSENGFVLQAGIRSLVSEHIELSGSLSYVDIADESDTGFNVSAMYHFTDQISAGLGYGKSDDANSLSLSAVLFF